MHPSSSTRVITGSRWRTVSSKIRWRTTSSSQIAFRRAFGACHDITERKMFGGLAFLYRGRMCCGIVGSDLMVRVPDDEFDAVARGRHVRPMDFTGRPLRGFVYVSPPGFRTAAALRTWLSRGERVAEEKATGPTKRRPSRKTGSAVGHRAIP
jgi:hypothetical protein